MTTATHKPDLCEGALIDDRYALQGEGLPGGSGVVFKAVDRISSSTVAIKFLKPSYVGRAEREERFSREFTFLERVTSPHIVRPLAQGKIAYGDLQRPYLVLEYIEGTTLQGRMACSPNIAAEEVLSIALQLAKALRACHRAGIVHRDIKPENVLLENAPVPGWFIPRSEGDPPEWAHVKLIDFSLAGDVNGPQVDRGQPGRLTSPLETPGTPLHMAPEQVRAEPAHPAMDLYAFGVVLYELIMGRNPFRDCQPEAFYQRQAVGMAVNDIYPFARRDLPEALLSLVGKCLNPDPKERPDIEAVVTQLTAHWKDLQSGDLLTANAARTNRYERLHAVGLGQSQPTRAPLLEPAPAPMSKPDAKEKPSARPPETHRARRYGLFALACTLLLFLGGGVVLVWLPPTVPGEEVLAATSLRQEESETLSEATFQSMDVPDVEEVEVAVDLPTIEPEPSDHPPIFEPPDRTKKKTRVRKRTASPCQDPAHAKSVVEAARTAASKRKWSTVVSLTEDQSCWREASTQRVRLRVEALATLRRWSECADLGQQSSDPQIRAIATRCIEKKSQ